MSEQVPTPGWMPVPTWERFPWLRAGFSTRQGGGSQVYGASEQNLGWTSEDDPSVVAANRKAFVSAVAGGAVMDLFTLQQVHGNSVCDLDNEAGPYRSSEGKALLQGDGLISRRPGRLLGIITADCIPVLVADTRHRAVAAFHAGWRGTVDRIVERGLHAMRTRYGSGLEDLVAAIGPSIGPCCFAVGEEVRARFLAEFSYGADLVSEAAARVGVEASAKVNLAEANHRQLLASGLLSANIQRMAECTACTRLPNGGRKYFSHRAEKGFTGRMMSTIGIAPAESV